MSNIVNQVIDYYRINSNVISVPSTPNVPPIGYYDTSNDANENVSNSILTANLGNSCSAEWYNNTLNGIYNNVIPPNDPIIPSNISNLDIPYYLAKSGKLKIASDTSPSYVDSSGNKYYDLKTTVANNCASSQQNLVNQIQYLTCQLENSRNRTYDHNNFKPLSDPASITEIFDKFKNIKFILVLVFLITMYLLVSGFFSSVDLAANIFNIIESKCDYSLFYFIGLLLGIVVPIIVLCIVYTKLVCLNISELEKYQINDNPIGISEKVDSALKSIDVMSVVLIIISVYGLIAVIFVLKKKITSKYIELISVTGILILIALIICVLYKSVPYFNNPDYSSDGKSIKLYVDKQEDVSVISSNARNDLLVRQAYIVTFIIIFIATIVFISIGSVDTKGRRIYKFLNGFLASFAILIIPILWCFNFILGITYFYIYPIVLIGIRFLRYVIMFGLYVRVQSNEYLKNTFSEDLNNQMENIKNYSPSWALIGTDIIKLILHMQGYSNVFSKLIIPDTINSKNLSSNTLVSAGLFKFLDYKNADNMKGMILNATIAIISIILTIIIVFGINSIKIK